MTEQANPADTLIQQIYEAAKRRGESRRLLARKANIHVNTLKKFGDPGWNPAFSTLHKLAVALLMGDEQPSLRAGGQMTSTTRVTRHRNVRDVKSNVAE